MAALCFSQHTPLAIEQDTAPPSFLSGLFPVELTLPLLLHPWLPNGYAVSAWSLLLSEQVRAADGYAVVSCEYIHSVPPGSPTCWLASARPHGLLSSPPAWANGEECVLPWRSVLFHLSLGVRPVSCHGLPSVQTVLDDSGVPVAGQDASQWEIQDTSELSCGRCSRYALVRQLSRSLGAAVCASSPAGFARASGYGRRHLSTDVKAGG